MGVLLSLATAVPLAMMTHQYLSTRDTYYNVNGTSRTAWPTNVETAFNNVYFTFAVISLLLNVITLWAYFRGIEEANKTARVATIWSVIIVALHLIAMITGVAVYGAGADSKAKDGTNRDLWGWSCSSAAENIQPWVKDTKFSKWCTVQVS